MSEESLYTVEATGNSVEEAIEAGLKEIGLSRKDVIIEVLSEGRVGLFGTGSSEAIVRLIALRTPSPAKPASDDVSEEVDIATGILEELLDMMGYPDTDVHVGKSGPTPHNDQDVWVLDVKGHDLGSLIGRRGETLDALQYLTRMMVSREVKARANFIVDVEGYKTRREQSLYKLAERMAAQARRSGRTVTLEPMPANERRIIHIALRDDRTVETESVGEGKKRKVTITPV